MGCFPCILEEALLNKLKPYPRRAKIPPRRKFKTVVFSVLSSCITMMCAAVGVAVILGQTKENAIMYASVAVAMILFAIVLDLFKE